jgi:hypothetical protein
MDNNAANDEDNQTSTQTKTPQFAMMEQTSEDITLSSICIRQALKIVSGIITESDQVRKELVSPLSAGSSVSWLSRNQEPQGSLEGSESKSRFFDQATSVPTSSRGEQTMHAGGMYT